jgi:hypothetical protein
MQGWRVSIQAGVAVALLAALIPQIAKGDGGVMLLHEARGAFLVTVFVSPEAARGGLTDLSVLVQSSTSGDVLLDADVGLAVDPPKGMASTPSKEFCGASSAPAGSQLPDVTQLQGTVRATREQASNKLLYAAALNLNSKGDWRLHVYVSRQTDNAQFDCLIPVTQASANAPGLWFCLLIPPIAIAGFAINQKLRKHSLEQGPDSQSRSLCRG